MLQVVLFFPLSLNVFIRRECGEMLKEKEGNAHKNWQTKAILDNVLSYWSRICVYNISRRWIRLGALATLDLRKFVLQQ